MAIYCEGDQAYDEMLSTEPCILVQTGDGYSIWNLTGDGFAFLDFEPIWCEIEPW